jgi:hypothetical protein
LSPSSVTVISPSQIDCLCDGEITVTEEGDISICDGEITVTEEGDTSICDGEITVTEEGDISL